MKALLLMNPYSGRGISSKDKDYIIKSLEEVYELDVFVTQGPRSITAYVEGLSTTYDIFIIAGGDGTIHEAITGLLKLSYIPRIGFIPRGTMNDIGRSYGYTKSIKRCVEILKNGTDTKANAYAINDTYFFYGFAKGRYASVSYLNNNRKYFGRISYYFSCLKEFFTSKPTTITINGETRKYSQIFIINAKYLAGYRMVENPKETLRLYGILAHNRFRDTLTFLFFLLSEGRRHRILIESNVLDIESDSKTTLDGEEYDARTLHITKKNNAFIIKKKS